MKLQSVQTVASFPVSTSQLFLHTVVKAGEWRLGTRLYTEDGMSVFVHHNYSDSHRPLKPIRWYKVEVMLLII